MKKQTIPKIATFKIDELVAADYNPRIISDEALSGLTKSIERFGFVEPIVINVRGGKKRIIGGHQRVRALQSLGIKQVMCVTVNCTQAEEKLLNLSLNNPYIQGKFLENLNEYIEQLQGEISDDSEFLDLQIDKLKIEINKKPLANQKVEYKEEKLKPYKKTHVLLSFKPEVLLDIQDHLTAIIKHPDIEYEQGSN